MKGVFQPGIRLVIAITVVAITVAVLLAFGLNATSAVIQLVLWVVGIVSYAVIGNGSASGLRARNIRSERGGIEVEHRGGGPVSAENLKAEKDIRIKHEAGH